MKMNILTVTICAIPGTRVDIERAVNELHVELLSMQLATGSEMVTVSLRTEWSPDELSRALRDFLGTRRYMLVSPASPDQVALLSDRGLL